MLRLKGETDHALQDDRPDLEEQDRITSRDAFPDGDPEWRDEEEGALLPRLPLRGLAIAGVTFVPTFLLIFFGVPYLLAPDGPIQAAIATVRSASEAPPAEAPPVTRSEAPRSGRQNRAAVEPRVAPAPMPESSKADEATPPTAAQPPLPPPASSARSAQVKTPAPPEPRAPEAASPEPSLPPAPRRAAPSHRPTPEPRSSQEARSARNSRGDSRVADSRVVDAKPAVSREGGDWTPAAAFTDRAAANRLASSIEKQGYPVEIRQDGSSSRPWVVWIGAQPSGGSRRR